MAGQKFPSAVIAGSGELPSLPSSEPASLASDLSSNTAAHGGPGEGFRQPGDPIQHPDHGLQVHCRWGFNEFRSMYNSVGEEPGDASTE